MKNQRTSDPCAREVSQERKEAMQLKPRKLTSNQRHSLALAAAICLAIAGIAIPQGRAAPVGNAPASGLKTTVIEPEILWQHAYGDDDLFAADVIQTSDGNFAVTGEYQYFTSSGAEGGAIYLLKVGAHGLKLSQTFEDHGLLRFYSGAFIQQTDDMGFIVAGTGTKLAPPSAFFYLVKYDADGNTLWSQEYGRSTASCTCSAATATPDGGYLLAGTAQYSSIAEYVYVVKTDAQGEMEWDRIIMNPAGLGDTGGIARSVTVAPGGYAITGVSYDRYGTGLDSAFLLRLSDSGKVMTAQHYNFLLPGTTKTYLDGHSIQYTKDGFIIGGSAYGYDATGLSQKAAFLLKLSTSGNVRWYKPCGVSTFSCGYSVCQTRDGGYILAGITGFYDVSSSIHAYITRTDSNGNELWTKTITQFAVSSGSKIIGTSDGGYIVTGMAVPGAAADTLLVRIAPDIVPRR